jgi:hypothetical protein
MSIGLDIKGVQEAADRIKGVVHETPIHTSSFVDRLTNKQVFFKCELFQKTGSFKVSFTVPTSVAVLADAIQLQRYHRRNAGCWALATPVLLCQT